MKSTKSVNVTNLKNTLAGLIEEKRQLTLKIKNTGHNEDLKFDLEIVNNNIETV